MLDSFPTLRHVRVDGDSAVTSFLPPKVFLHPPFAPDIVEANKHSVEESSLKNRIPKMLLQCTEKTTNELCAVQRKAHKELERLKAVEAGHPSPLVLSSPHESDTAHSL